VVPLDQEAVLNELLYKSATNLAALIRRREVSSREVVDAHIARIEDVNPRLNAVVAERFAAARAEADRADAALRGAGGSSAAAAGAGGELPPFHGVPCTIKESIALAGMPFTSGLVARTGVVADEDATPVARMRRAGFIPLGVTNISELCMWMESNNHVYGRTNNPYDPRRTVGGSSGGEGAIVGAGGSPVGLGADVGGSIRMPAFFNGVFGHKPTGGLVPGTGQYPVARGDVRRYNTTGPICRRAEDLMPLLRIIAGPDGRDGGCREFSLGDPDAVRIDTLTVLDVEDNGTTSVSDDLRAARAHAVSALRARGARVEAARFPALRESFAIWSSMMRAADGPSFGELLGNGTDRVWALELGRWALRRSPHTLPALALAMMEKLAKRMPRAAEKARALGAELKAELTARLGDRGVIVYPPYAEPAPRHGKPLWPPFNWVYTAIFNVMEFPSTQFPLGLNADGVPLGAQVASVAGNDHVTIAVARALEQDLGGWTPPPA
jgi:fatty acid amide hydrolase 2